MKKINKFLYTLVFTCLILILGLVTLANFGNYKLLAVQSGSMTPAISTGSMVVVKSFEDYAKGDVITFKREKDKYSSSLQNTTTHRIAEVQLTDQGIEYFTKGDANNGRDNTPVTKDLVIGRVILSVPFLGYFIYFTKTLPGFILLVIIPATLIIFNELIFLLKTLLNYVSKKNQKRGNWLHLELKHYCLLLTILSLPLVVNTKASHAYLVDQTVVTSSFTAGVFPYASLSLSSDKKTVSFTAGNVSDFTHISYELTYDTDSEPEGAKGDTDLHGENEFTRDIPLGTYSPLGGFVYHTGVNNFILKIDLKDNDGNITTLQDNL